MSAALLHPDDDLSEGTTLANDRFEVEGLVGFGASGVVYAAIDRNSGEKVALKVLARQCVGIVDREARFEREARVGTKISAHPNLVAIREAGRLDPPDNRRYVVLEFVRGPTLGQLARRERLEPGTIVAFARDLACGLQALHGSGIVHRDLKPTNVLVDKGRSPAVARITDFGLALETGTTLDPADDVTRADQRPGTPVYMAPEQFAGVRSSFAADIYALGATLYEIAGGGAPFAGVRPEEIHHVKLRGDPPGPHLSSLRSDLPPALVDLVDACMRADPAERPDADTIVARLGVGPRAPSGAPSTGLRQSPTFARGLGITALVAVGIGVAWLSFAARSDPDTEETGHADLAVESPDNGEPSAATRPIDGPSAVAPTVLHDVGAAPSTEVAVHEPADAEATSAAGESPTPAPSESKAARPDTRSTPRPPATSHGGASVEPGEHGPDCASLRKDAELAADGNRWREVLEATRTRHCWPDAVARARLRVRANAELRRWSACVREGAEVGDAELQSWLDLCRRKAMEQ